MGNAISVGEVVKDWRVFGVQSAVPPIRTQRAEDSCDRMEKPVQVGDRQLENDFDGLSGVECLDIRRFGETSRRITRSQRGERIRRWGIAAVVVWCIFSDVMLVKSYLALRAIEGISKEIQVKAKEIRTDSISHNLP